MLRKNVMVCSAGRRVSLVKAFQAELRSLIGSESLVVTTDLDPDLSPACRVSDRASRLGRFTDPGYSSDLLHLCVEHDVGIVLPTLDTELRLLSENVTEFRQQGVEVVVSGLDLVSACRNKRSTNALFDSIGLKTPDSVDLKDIHYPFFVKPIDGSSSKNIFVIDGPEQISPWLMDEAKFLHLEYFSPADYSEFTVDLYYDKNSRLKCAVPRRRIAVRGGEIAKGRTEKGGIYRRIWDAFATLDGARGCITLQVFESKTTGELFGIEINPRFGGGYPLSYLAGANYPGFLIREYLLGETLDVFEDWQENLLLLRYDADMVFCDE